MITSAEVADRFGNSRPGFELVAVEEVGLPFFRLTLEVIVQEPSPLPTIEEFVLRSVVSGLNQPEDVAGLLGLEADLVDQAIVNQHHEDHLDYQWDPKRGKSHLAITSLGESALEEATLVRQRREISIGFDRLLWTPTGRRTSQLLSPKDSTDRQLVEVPPRSKQRLKVSDLDKDSVDRAIRELPFKGASRTELLALTHVRNFRCVLPAFALVYVGDDGTTSQVGLVIDGRLSDEHEKAFADADGPARCGLIVQERPAEGEWGCVPNKFADSALNRIEVQTLRSREARAEEDLENTRTATAALGDERASSLGSKNEEELRATAVSLNTQLQTPPARAIQTYEHLELLNAALANAAERVLIITPRLGAAVVTANFVQRLERLCRNRVAVTIGYEAPPADSEGIGAEALTPLHDLSARSRYLQLGSVETIDERVLLWDSNLVVTSFNWLSYRDEQSRQYRQEIGALITDVDYVEEQYDAYRGMVSRQVTPSE